MFVVFVLVQLALGFWFFRRTNLDRTKAAFAYTSPNSNGLIVLSFSEIEELTENFKHQIGPKVFKGVLPNKKPVAIKDLNITIKERKYRSAVSKIGSIHHKNLVKLQGYCCELDHRFVVYEYAKNGSVEKYIEDLKLCKKLTWGKRFDICLSVARAICYLHTSCREFMRHGNLKCENVVLEENLEAKVTEFGLGKVVSEASCSSAERDVEDFGKMVLLLVSGCRGVGDLFEWAYKEWMEGRPENIVDKRISGGFNLQELERSLGRV
ncbi:G-type lectin S-receptor-like serine/threonine-protein kinase SD3-1 [Prunus yedoensis var. nudiflora]|uniref:G-type lectin S-receptor-like serine/threonine-protein kinase SD3-1 n=1 Tax=Prunus yedoensis var. nudiflora TaxID=2094558 RepID=A0A314YX01_PRUYE|nr:G-type lectin S-receptor-like serine/threonine-protein kinase SD3-1 [Prunus yedoensis var. nudiflora]